MSTLRCPKCNHAIVIQRGQAQATTRVACSSCGATFKLSSSTEPKGGDIEPIVAQVAAEVVPIEPAFDPFSVQVNEPFNNPLTDPLNDPFANPFPDSSQPCSDPVVGFDFAQAVPVTDGAVSSNANGLTLMPKAIS